MRVLSLCGNCGHVGRAKDVGGEVPDWRAGVASTVRMSRLVMQCVYACTVSMHTWHA